MGVCFEMGIIMIEKLGLSGLRGQVLAMAFVVEELNYYGYSGYLGLKGISNFDFFTDTAVFTEANGCD